MVFRRIVRAPGGDVGTDHSAAIRHSAAISPKTGSRAEDSRGMAAASSLMGEMAFCLSLPSFIDKISADAHIVNVVA